VLEVCAACAVGAVTCCVMYAGGYAPYTTVEGELCLLEVLKVMRCALLCIPKAAESGLRSPEMSEVP